MKVDLEYFNKRYPPVRKNSDHKYTRGHVLVIAGSEKYAGAAILCACAARETGIGYISVASPEKIHAILLNKIPDAVVADTGEWEDLIQNKVTSVVVGPGMVYKEEILSKIFSDFSGPTICDGGALQPELVHLIRKLKPKQTVLTPHQGEFSRCFPHLKNIERVSAIKKAAEETNSVVVLKGHETLIANPDAVAINEKSTSALARAGTGDVLAGMIGSLAGQGLSPFDAACCSVFWHSQAAIRLEKEKGTEAVYASSLIENLHINFY